MKRSIQAVVTAGLFTLAFFAVAHGAVGAPPTSEAARVHYRAAAQGDPEAQAKLGELYASGIEVEQSDATAFQWFMRAAAQGHSRAQLTLAEIWANGRGVPRSDTLAYRWALIARSNSVDPAIREAADRLIAAVATKLYADQIAEAVQHAAEWRPDVESSQTVAAEPAAAATKALPRKPAYDKAAAARGGKPGRPSVRARMRAESSAAAERRRLRALIMQRIARRLGL
jgi:TPR repeat protein